MVEINEDLGTFTAYTPMSIGVVWTVHEPLSPVGGKTKTAGVVDLRHWGLCSQNTVSGLLAACW